MNFIKQLTKLLIPCKSKENYKYTSVSKITEEDEEEFKRLELSIDHQSTEDSTSFFYPQ